MKITYPCKKDRLYPGHTVCFWARKDMRIIVLILKYRYLVGRLDSEDESLEVSIRFGDDIGVESRERTQELIVLSLKIAIRKLL